VKQEITNQPTIPAKLFFVKNTFKHIEVYVFVSEAGQNTVLKLQALAMYP